MTQISILPLPGPCDVFLNSTNSEKWYFSFLYRFLRTSFHPCCHWRLATKTFCQTLALRGWNLILHLIVISSTFLQQLCRTSNEHHKLSNTFYALSHNFCSLVCHYPTYYTLDNWQTKVLLFDAK